jgi:hypothetical protein
LGKASRSLSVTTTGGGTVVALPNSRAAQPGINNVIPTACRKNAERIKNLQKKIAAPHHASSVSGRQFGHTGHAGFLIVSQRNRAVSDRQSRIFRHLRGTRASSDRRQLAAMANMLNNAPSMPQSISIGAFVLGGVLLLVALVGGNFKIFGAEVSAKISSVPIRILAGLLGLSFVLVAFSPSIGITPENKALEKVSAPSQPQETVRPAEAPPISRAGVAIVFDPPSNVRESPSASSNVLCSVRAKTTINIMEPNGPWYATDVCGKVGYIHRSQLKFSE